MIERIIPKFNSIGIQWVFRQMIKLTLSIAQRLNFIWDKDKHVPSHRVIMIRCYSSRHNRHILDRLDRSAMCANIGHPECGLKNTKALTQSTCSNIHTVFIVWWSCVVWWDSGKCTWIGVHDCSCHCIITAQSSNWASSKPVHCTSSHDRLLSWRCQMSHLPDCGQRRKCCRVASCQLLRHYLTTDLQQEPALEYWCCSRLLALNVWFPCLLI